MTHAPARPEERDVSDAADGAEIAGSTVGRAVDDAGDLLRALTAARLAADLLAAADVRCDRPELDIAAVVRALDVAVEHAALAAGRLLADGGDQ